MKKYLLYSLILCSIVGCKKAATEPEITYEFYEGYYYSRHDVRQNGVMVTRRFDSSIAKIYVETHTYAKKILHANFNILNAPGGERFEAYDYNAKNSNRFYVKLLNYNEHWLEFKGDNFEYMKNYGSYNDVFYYYVKAKKK